MIEVDVTGTWELPDFRSFELVPVTDLGLMIAVIKGHVIVSQVKQYSVTGEDHKVSIYQAQISIYVVILMENVFFNEINNRN